MEGPDRAPAAHPDRRVDLICLTPPLDEPGPAVGEGQRYRQVTWDAVLPLVQRAFGADARPEVATCLAAVTTVVGNLGRMQPAEQRAEFIGTTTQAAPSPEPLVGPSEPAAPPALLELARATAADGRQRALGATSPEHLEGLRDEARDAIAALPADDPTHAVLPWLWHAGSSGGGGVTPEGREFGYELRFSHYGSRRPVSAAE